MHDQLEAALNDYRKSRRFNAKLYVEAKCALINEYFKQSGLSGCVVGISGGVDSAVTLGMILHAKKQPGSHIKQVLALVLPMYGDGATHQDTASSRGAEVAAAFGVECTTIDLSSTLDTARNSSFQGTGIRGTPWAAGQLVSYLRTPMLYYQAAILAEQGFPAVVCGTTNRDEGSYIGFFGKTSDGMVDLQPISDIHKSEVYQLAELLNVPHSVSSAVPTGDTYDGLCDEEMIGAPYNALELYTHYLCEGKKERESWIDSLSADAKREFNTWMENLEKLHKKNLHKYIGDSPAIHFDLYPRAVPGGWRPQRGEYDEVPNMRERALAARVGPVELPSTITNTLCHESFESALSVALGDFGELALLVRKLLTPRFCETVLEDWKNWPWVAADFHGRAIADTQKLNSIGSYRATAYSEDVADILWKRLAPHLPPIRIMDDLTPTDWNGHRVWRPVGINPMLRFIRYESGGAIVPHYDAGFDYQDTQRYTLQSVIITLTPKTDGQGGNTRFLLDSQRGLPLDERDFSDLNHLASDNEVLMEVLADCGDCLVFDHRIFHDASIWNSPNPRIILRTDIIYERNSSHAIAPSRSIVQSPPVSSDDAAGLDVTYRKALSILGSFEAVEEAGYFNDSLEAEYSSESTWWTGPIDKVLTQLNRVQDISKELVVIVTTGAFCPVHRGHLELLETAKLELESRGKAVIGGYLAPDHDSYVSSKCGPGALSAAERVELCERAVSNSEWLMVDRWAALHAPTAVNFTRIIDHIQKFLSENLRTHRPIRVVYAFGGDNAKFVHSFVGRGSCVCVLRPGSNSAMEEVMSLPLISENPRIIFSWKATPGINSTTVRRGDTSGLPDAVKARWNQIKSITPGDSDHPTERLSFYIRHEGDWAVELWKGHPNINPQQLSRAYENFSVGVTDLFNDIFSQAQNSPDHSQIQVIPLMLDEQVTLFKTQFGNKKVISLDPCLPGDVNLEISRCFKPLSNDEPYFVSRPGAISIESQLSQIQNEHYVLFDDDSFSGKTEKYALSLLSRHCTVERFQTLCNASGTLDSGGNIITHPAPRLNLVDCRDFLAGAREAGLVLQLASKVICRAPYVLPYVRPNHRASVSPANEIRFSREIWSLNKSFFSSLGGELYVRDMSPAFRNLCSSQKIELDMSMREFCDWHINKLGGV